VNSGGPELGPELHGDTLYFNSARRSGLGGLDIYEARQTPSGFAAPTALPAPLNSASSEGDFTLSANGRVALFWSDRPGGLGEGDIYLSVRQGDGWSTPVNLGAPVNSAAFDFTPSLSRDGRWLYFSSTRKVDGADVRSDIYRLPVSAVPVLKEALRR
jgi:Tol biopolymer transport system component